MRLFLAVELDASMRSAAEKAAGDLRGRIGRRLDARWVKTDNLHLTVRFIGHVADERVQPVVDAVKPAVGISPFDVALRDCGVFPPHGPPRVLWIGLRDGLPSLAALHDEFNRRLAPLGFEPENRPFSAHLTLARIKDAPRGSGAATRDALRGLVVPRAQCRVSEVVLFESRLSPKGSTYVPQLRVPLRP